MGAMSVYDASLMMGTMQNPTEVVDQTITLMTTAGEIHGSLTGPASVKKIPVVLIIAGSGATDRDGNSLGVPGKNNCLKMLACALAEAGFASVRYDKRGVGASSHLIANEADLRFETYVQDAVAWVEKLATDSRFSGVAIVGHSEGSLVGILAASKCAAKSFVSIAGLAQSASAALRSQLKGKLTGDLEAVSEEALSALEAGRRVVNIPPELALLYRPSVQPYLISWFNYVPAVELKKLRVPCLILQGDTDIQVSVSEALALHAAKPDSDIEVIHRMNHVLKLVTSNQAQQVESYSDPALPISPDLCATISRFLCATTGYPATTDTK
jgi:uncharacterized protein